MKISVAILTFNEEQNIQRCLESIKWADEIVLVDEKSTDNTVKIAKKYTSKVFLVNHDPMFHKNKQIALDKCTGDWILQIDADEEISPELKREILTVLESSPNENGFKVPRKNFIFGKWMEHTGWYPDYQVKLFRKGKGKLPCETVHEHLEIDGEIGTLKSDLIHHHYYSVAQFVDRMNRYTTNDAKYLLKKGETVVWTDAIKFPLDEFLKRFFYLEGYKDGLHGLVLSLLKAADREIVFAKVWENQKFWECNNDEFRDEVIKYSKNISHDWRHWVTKTEKNPVRAAIYKFKNKLLT